jgi:L-seryl-tRNA(Ser) seleniumtransferase
MIRATPREIEERSRHFIRELTRSIPMDRLDIEITNGESLAGGGSTPAQSLRTKVIRIRSDRLSASQIEQRLRRGAATSVIARVEDNSVVLDLRTVFAEQETALAEAIAAALR